jgi:hypothetical protein
MELIQSKADKSTLYKKWALLWLNKRLLYSTKALIKSLE